MKTVIYPGTFDPITNGHLDIIERAARLFDTVIVAVSGSPVKQPLFSPEERKNMIDITVQAFSNVTVEIFEGLLVNYAKARQASALVRGLRAVSDFEYEFQMALMNRKIMPDLEMVYLMPSQQYTYINSSIVKEVARLGGSVTCFLPPYVADKVADKFRNKKD